MQYNYKGTYNIATAYAVKDVVSYQPTVNDPVKYYFCLTANTGQVPTVGVDSVNWGIVNALSNFPNSVDTFQFHPNIQASDKVSLTRFQNLSLQTSLTQAEADELATLTQTLRNKLILAEDINALQDSVSNMQMFLHDSVTGYINQKQAEFQAKVDKFSDKGIYSSATTYQATNFVTYLDEIYICLVDNTVNIPPTDITKWRKAASKGGKGDTGLSANYKGEYNSSTSYVLGDAVSYQGSFYYAKTSVSGIAPTDNTKWQIINNLFIGASAPSAPPVNQAWLDTVNKKIKYWDGLAWVENNASDSDKLGGQLPAYYATAQSVTDNSNKIGVLSNLTTTDKSNLVNAINEHKAEITPHAELVARTITVGIGKNFTTIQAAINSIKKRLEADITITVDAGTYPEDVSIQGFSGKGNLYLNGDTVVSTTRTVNSINSSNNSIYVGVTGFNAISTTTHTFLAVRGYNDFSYCQSIGTSTSFGVLYVSSVGAFSNGVVSNRAKGISATSGSTVLSNANTGTGNTIGLASDAASTVGKLGTQPAGTTAELANAGGIIR